MASIKDRIFKMFINGDSQEPIVRVADATSGILDLMISLLDDKTYDKYCKRTVDPDIFYDFYNNGNIFTTFRVEFNATGWCVSEENFLLLENGDNLLQENGDSLLFNRNS